jgi:hypothetical protein
VKQYVSYSSDGQITQIIISDDPSKFGITIPFLELEVYPKIDPSEFYVAGGQTIQKGKRPNDRAIFEYSSGLWVTPDPTVEELEIQWSKVRTIRNGLLSACDWTQVPDAPVDGKVWADYRQHLRDVTLQPDPFSIVWPTPPTQ